MLEVINFYNDKILNSDILIKMGLKYKKYFLASIHREENLESNTFERIIKVLNFIASKYNLPIILSTHPRTRKRIMESINIINDNIKMIKPLSFSDYNNLQINAKAVISDSGTINEESSILNFPAINFRENHERPEAMEETSVIMTGFNQERVIQSLELVSNQKRAEQRILNTVDDYSYENVSEKLVRIILSYTDYVQKIIWKNFNN